MIGLPAVLATQPFEVRAGGDPGRLSLEPSNPTPEDPLRLTMRSPCPAQTSFDPPEIEGSVITVVERVNNAILAPCFDANRDIEKFELGLFEAGEYTLQLFTVETDLVGKGEIPEDPSLVTQFSVGEAPPALELGNGRFRVTARWKEPGGDGGVGEPFGLTEDTGYFWFFDPDNVEVVVKVLDACSFDDHFWVFAGGLTNVEVELTVEDTLGAVEQVYVNRLGDPFEPIQDTKAFATCNALP